MDDPSLWGRRITCEFRSLDKFRVHLDLSCRHGYTFGVLGEVEKLVKLSYHMPANKVSTTHHHCMSQTQ